MKTLWLKPLRDLNQMKMRAITITLMVAAGVGMYGGGFMSRDTLFHTRDTLYSELHLADLRVNTTAADPTELPSLENIEGVESYEKRLITPGALELESGRPLAALIIYIDPERLPEVNQLKVLEGRYFDPEDPHGVIIDRALAENHGYKVGDTIELNPYSFPSEVNVIGIGTSPECLIATVDPSVFIPMKGSLGIIFAPLGLIEELFGYPLYNDFSFIFKEEMDKERAEEKVLAALGPLGVDDITRKEEEFAYKFLEEDLKAFSIFVPSVVFVFAIIIFLITLITANRLVISQRKEIGALRALGYRRGELSLSYFLIVVIMSVGGGLLGAAWSLGLNVLFAGQYAMTVGLPYIIPKVVVLYVVQGWLYMSAVVFLAFFLPLFLFMRLTPQQIIREDQGKAFVGLPLIVEKMVGLFTAVFQPGMPLRFGFRNLFRRPGLTAATTVSVALCIALMASFLIVQASYESLIEEMMAREQWDMVVNFRLPQSPERVKEIRRTKGIQEAIALVNGFGQVLINGETQNYQLIGIPAQGNMREIEIVQGRMFQTDDEKGIILNKNWVDRERLDLRVGKAVEVKVGDRTEQLPIVALMNDMTIGRAYLPFRTAQELMGVEEKVSALMCSISRPVDELKKDLYCYGEVGNIFAKTDVRKGIDLYLDMLRVLLYIGQSISIGIAVFFLFGSVVLNILERQSEYATLRAIGYGRTPISKIVLTELMSEGCTGIVASVPVAILLALYLNHQASQTWLYIPTVVNATDLLILGGLALLLIPLACIPGLRHIFRMNIPEVVRRKVMG